MPPRRTTAPTPTSRPAAERLLLLLKTRGPQTSADLATALGVTGEAVRQQLIKLAADGLVTASAEPRGVGRPSQFWSLTAEGNARFPDAHAELTAQLQATLESIWEGIIDTDPDGRIVNMNRRFAAMWEIPEALLLEDSEPIRGWLKRSWETPASPRRRWSDWRLPGALPPRYWR